MYLLRFVLEFGRNVFCRTILWSLLPSGDGALQMRYSRLDGQLSRLYQTPANSLKVVRVPSNVMQEKDVNVKSFAYHVPSDENVVAYASK